MTYDEFIEECSVGRYGPYGFPSYGEDRDGVMWCCNFYEWRYFRIPGAATKEDVIKHMDLPDGAWVEYVPLARPGVCDNVQWRVMYPKEYEKAWVPEPVTKESIGTCKLGAQIIPVKRDIVGGGDLGEEYVVSTVLISPDVLTPYYSTVAWNAANFEDEKWLVDETYEPYRSWEEVHNAAIEKMKKHIVRDQI